MVDEGKLYDFEKQFGSPLNEKCFKHEKISVIKLSLSASNPEFERVICTSQRQTGTSILKEN